MGFGHSKPANRDKKLRDRSQDDDNDNDIELDRMAAVVAPNGNIYENVGALLDAGEQQKVASVAKAESAQLQSVADAQTTTNAVAHGAGQSTAQPKVKNKAAKIAALLFGGAVVGAGITAALFLAGVIKAAEEADTAATTPVPTNPPAPGAPEFQKVVASFASLPESEFWPAYKTVIDQFAAGLEVQKLVAAYIVSITAPTYFKNQGTAEFATKTNYQAAAKTIVSKVMATSNKDALLAYDEVAKADKSTLSLGRTQLENGANATRLLRVGLLIVVLDQLMEANK
jgi:hypothetical protein